MPYTMDDFLKEVTLEGLDKLTPEERSRGLPAEERLRGLPAVQIEACLRQLRQEPKGVGAKKRKRKR
ncbi:MAG: hypothetical protein L0Y71_08200 [Gemmataceae bacterium]|nr:hypothetical protein [Gemmataceae bacterium]